MAITIDGTNGLSSDNAALKLDGTTLVVDDTNNRVGVGTASPAVAMDVVGQVRASTGILFGSDTAAANALDDYEEGTWTPNVGGNATYSDRNATYTKIGNIVTCQFYIAIGTLGTGSSALLSGFPFTAGGSYVQAGSCSYYSSLALNTIFVAMYVNSNATTAYFIGKSSSGNTVDNAISLFGNGTTIYGTVTYRVA